MCLHQDFELQSNYTNSRPKILKGVWATFLSRVVETGFGIVWLERMPNPSVRPCSHTWWAQMSRAMPPIPETLHSIPCVVTVRLEIRRGHSLPPPSAKWIPHSSHFTVSFKFNSKTRVLCPVCKQSRKNILCLQLLWRWVGSASHSGKELMCRKGHQMQSEAVVMSHCVTCPIIHVSKKMSGGIYFKSPLGHPVMCPCTAVPVCSPRLEEIVAASLKQWMM